MDEVQLISELIQPGDFGMLVDLKDAYLTLGLHPSSIADFGTPSPVSAFNGVQ